MKSFLKVTFPILILSLSLFACKKTVEKNINGVWRVVNVINPTDTIVKEWNFTEHYIYFIKSYMNAPDSSIVEGRCTFRIKASPFRRKLIIENSTIGAYQATWEIDKLNNKSLVLITDDFGGVVYKEFTKK